MRLGEVVDGAPVDEKLDQGLTRTANEYSTPPPMCNENKARSSSIASSRCPFAGGIDRQIGVDGRQREG